MQKKERHKSLFFLSGYQDSNLGPPGPKPGALTGLRYTPKYYGGERGIRTPGTGYPVRQFSKLVVSATHPPLRERLGKSMKTFVFCKGLAKKRIKKERFFASLL